MSCCVSSCKNYRGKRSDDMNGVSFHSFPVDESLKQAWIKQINREGWTPQKDSKICSTHFHKEDFVVSKTGSKRIRKGAFPSLGLNVLVKRQAPMLSSEGSSSLQEFLIFNDTPRKKRLKHEIAQLRSKANRDRLEIGRLRSKIHRLKKKAGVLLQSQYLSIQQHSKPKTTSAQVKKLSTLIEELENKNLILGEESEILSSINVKVADLLQRQRISKIKKVPLRQKYSPALRSFALTLHYFSPRAYRYVRKTFDTCLPHPRTISKWYESVNGEAGFTAEAFNTLKLKANSSGKRLLCSLMMDEVAIKKHVEWDGNKYHGYVDLGLNEVQSDNMDKASQALVLLLVCQTEQWKLPVGFFFIHSMTGEQRASIVRQCLSKCDKNGVDVISLTMDGCAANIAMLKKLGCSLEPEKMRTTFEHPNANYDIAVFLDACHMLKLVRNALENRKRFIDYQGNSIEWSYLVKLNNLQKFQGLHIANKLRNKHIHFERQKMKVKLASQLFSNSVADALRVCEMNSAEFENVDGTIHFVRVVNNIFDVLNSRNMYQLDYKKPLFEGNILKTKEFLEYAKGYLTHIVVPDEDKPITITNRKTGFVGFLTCINSAIFLYDKLVEQEKKIERLALHKMSQDHLELFFGILRARGGANNNPTARQFKSAYKKILITTEIQEGFTGNCIPLDDIAILNESSVNKINASSERSRITETESFIETNTMPDDLLLEFDEHLNATLSDNLRRQIIAYIAGFVVKYLNSKIKCESCLSALHADDYEDDHYLIKVKNRGGLTIPSKDVINICIRTECSIRSVKSQSLNSPNFRKHKVVSNTLTSLIGENYFSKSEKHMFDQSPLQNHIVLLTKSIAEKYVDIRFRHFATIENDTLTNRQILTKSIIFAGN